MKGSRLVLAAAPGASGDHGVKMTPRQAEKIIVTLITITKNNQGEGGKEGYCLAGVQEGNDRQHSKLIRLVPGLGHFWTEADLPPNLQEKHLDARATRLESEPH